MVSDVRKLEASDIGRGRVFVTALMTAPDPLPFLSSLGVAGNGWQENLLKPVTSGAKDHGSDGALQWRDTPPRMRLGDLQKLENWDTLPVQAAYFKWECKTYYPKLWAVLINPGSRSVATLTADIQDWYEIPNQAYANLDNRIAAAQQLQTELADLAPGIPQSAPTSSTIPQIGVSTMPLDPALAALLAQVIESAFAGILKAIIQSHQAAQAQTSPVVPVIPGLPQIPGFPPLNPAILQAIEQAIAAQLATLNRGA